MICNFCYRHCDIKESEFGLCGLRTVKNSKLISIAYGYLDAMAIDPIEKKPLYHFLPGSKSLSIAECGCNFKCDFCQNWQLSQCNSEKGTTYISPSNLIKIAIKYNVSSISFTYSEPIIWQDYVIDVSLLAKKNGIKTVMVTNGSFSKDSLIKLSKLIDAFNIDLKGDELYYKNICKGALEPVLNGIEYLIKNNCHVEVTTMLIESFHTKSVIEQLGKLLKDRGVCIWHLTRFYPNYKMSEIKETSEEFLLNAIEIAKCSGVPYIYGGNSIVSTPTVCSKCKHLLISSHNCSDDERFDVINNIVNGKCVYCGNPIYGVFK